MGHATTVGSVFWEIGCGPVWTTDRRVARGRSYVASDVLEGLPRNAGTAVRADGRRLPLAPASLDRALLKNVLGDPGLGETTGSALGLNDLDPADYRRYLVEEVLPSGPDEIRRVGDLLLETKARVAAAKDALLAELARVLAPRGVAGVVETMTPTVAGAYLRGRRLSEGLEVQPLRGYARRRDWCTNAELADSSLEVWLLRRR